MSHTSFAFQVLMFVQGTSCRAFIKPAPKSTLPSKSYTQGSFLERKNHRRGWRAIKTLSKISKWHWDVEEKMKFVCALWNACDCVRWGFGWGLCGNWPSITCGRDIDTPGRTRAHSTKNHMITNQDTTGTTGVAPTYAPENCAKI